MSVNLKCMCNLTDVRQRLNFKKSKYSELLEVKVKSLAVDLVQIEDLIAPDALDSQSNCSF